MPRWEQTDTYGKLSPRKMAEEVNAVTSAPSPRRQLRLGICLGSNSQRSDHADGGLMLVIM